MLLLTLLAQLPIDGGPVYAETNLTNRIAEPWNALSSLALVLPAALWMFKLKFNIRKYTFIYLSIPLLLAGGMGSLLYHASRTSSFLLYLDVLPTALLTVSVGIYFWWKLFRNWWYVGYIMVPAVGIRLYLLLFFTSEMTVNLSYFIAGIAIFLPVLLYLQRHNYHHLRTFFISLSCLLLSLVLRETDHWFSDYLPMGSHFLWHLFSGVGAYYLAYYLYQLRNEELENQS